MHTTEDGAAGADGSSHTAGGAGGTLIVGQTKTAAGDARDSGCHPKACLRAAKPRPAGHAPGHAHTGAIASATVGG